MQCEFPKKTPQRDAHGPSARAWRSQAKQPVRLRQARNSRRAQSTGRRGLVISMNASGTAASLHPSSAILPRRARAGCRRMGVVGLAWLLRAVDGRGDAGGYRRTARRQGRDGRFRALRVCLAGYRRGPVLATDGRRCASERPLIRPAEQRRTACPRRSTKIHRQIYCLTNERATRGR